MPAYVHDTSFFSRRAIVFLAIVALHILLFWMLTSGLARRVVEVIAPPIDANLIEELEDREEPPPPPPPEFERPPIEIPPPEVTINIPSDPMTTAITDVTTKPVPRTPAPAAPRTIVKAKAKSFPSTDDYYPAASIRLEEQGSAVVRTCVAPNGKLAEPPSIVTSSKSARLDEAAVKLTKAGRFIAGSIDGTPTTDCFNTRIRFELKK